ncbi:MAG: YciI family protein [Hyphomicrobiales bacterium]|nr:MAG: YciI family protein [Hyphomicrobiales bacterium]
MQKFMCLVYFDDQSFAGMTDAEDKALTDATIEEDRQLRAEGKLILAQPLQDPRTAVSVRVKGGKVVRTDGPFAETKEWLGGFTLLLARDMEEAVAISAASEITKRGRVEIRPVLEQTHSVSGVGRPAISETGA